MHRPSALAEDSVAMNDNANVLSPLSQPLQGAGGTAGRLKNAITVLMTCLSNRSFTSGLAALSLTALALCPSDDIGGCERILAGSFGRDPPLRCWQGYGHAFSWSGHRVGLNPTCDRSGRVIRSRNGRLVLLRKAVEKLSSADTSNPLVLFASPMFVRHTSLELEIFA
ncbi:hypothetical protein AOLI_G00231380 [Acnodon oligacanthus]